jgi:hypothetical protein
MLCTLISISISPFFESFVTSTRSLLAVSSVDRHNVLRYRRPQAGSREQQTSPRFISLSRSHLAHRRTAHSSSLALRPMHTHTAGRALDLRGLNVWALPESLNLLRIIGRAAKRRLGNLQPRRLEVDGAQTGYCRRRIW